ncbi:hypothetical protein LXL04_021991 [Taraxacum kok-saghyz]
MELKTLVTRNLEKKGVLAKIRGKPIFLSTFFLLNSSEMLPKIPTITWVSMCLFKAELRASVFEAIEEEDTAIEKDEGLPPALLGSCNDRARQLHASPSGFVGMQYAICGCSDMFSGRLLTAVICEYLDWAQLNHTLKVYVPECNLQKDVWKSELNDFGNVNGYDINRIGDSVPLLLDDSQNLRFVAIFPITLNFFLTPQAIPSSHASDRRGGSLNSGYRKDDYNRRYESDDMNMPDDVMRDSSALENLQLDRKTRNLTNSWRRGGDGSSEEDGREDDM